MGAQLRKSSTNPQKLIRCIAQATKANTHGTDDYAKGCGVIGCCHGLPPVRGGGPQRGPGLWSAKRKADQELDPALLDLFGAVPNLTAVIWDALKAACETDVETAKLIIDSAGIIVAAPDMHICYDELGAKYELPQYVLSDPINMAPSNPQQA
ncbi:hypothetical protein QJQ45_007092 [Haematococcus lacustris]|nr:hypothetical protein QJQ45_007092 [Haematococcus lacustris]